VVRLATRYACPLAVRSAVSRRRLRVGLQHLCDNSGHGADIAGAVGKQYGVTVLQGKRHDREVNELGAVFADPERSVLRISERQQRLGLASGQAAKLAAQ
jgi:hypothetical protein